MTTTQLGDHVVLQRGTTYKSALLDEPGPFLLGLASIQRNGGFRDGRIRTYGGASPAKLILGPGDLYVSLKDVTQSGDLLGAVARVPAGITAGRLTQDTVKLTITGGAGPMSAHYLYWLLRTPEYRAYCRTHAMGTTNLSLSRDDFLAFPVPEPTPARMALVELLELLDGKIGSNRRLSWLLAETAATWFRARFVDFAGVVKFDESDIGPIPRGWRVATLDEFVRERRERAEVTDGPYIGLDDMPRDSTVLDAWKTEGAPLGQSNRFRRRDILFGKLRPYFRKVGVAPIDGRCSTEIVVLRPLSSEVFGFAIGHLASSKFFEHCEAVSTGTRMPRAEWKFARQHRVAAPPTSQLSDGSVLACSTYDTIASLVHENTTLADLRDGLLLRLISGELRSQHAVIKARKANNALGKRFVESAT